MANSPQIAFRVDSETKKKLDYLVDGDRYMNRSEVIRDAIVQYTIKTCGIQLTPSIVLMELDVSKEVIKKLDYLIAEGEAVDKQDAILDAVRTYVREYKNQASV